MCRYQTPPDNTYANDVNDNDVTENDVIDSWMNMHTLLASRRNVVASTPRVDATRRDALGVNGALMLHRAFTCDLAPDRYSGIDFCGVSRYQHNDAPVR